MVGFQGLRALRISDFRNFEKATLSFAPSVNLFLGDNAQGKTNLLDAILLLCGVRPGRIRVEEDLILFGRREARVEAETVTAQGSCRMEILLQKGSRRRVLVNGKPVPRGLRAAGFLRQVFFSPEDVERPSGGSAGRRALLDGFLLQQDPQYVENWGKYHDILMQRNRLLGEIQKGLAVEKALDPWDELLLGSGVRVMETRREASLKLSAAAGKHYKTIAGKGEKGADSLGLRYLRSWERGDRALPGTTEEIFTRLLGSTRNEDLRRGQTTVGPHRDDLMFWLGERPMKTFGSRGQHRSAVLAFKLAEWDALRDLGGSPPLLLLDDALSELDGPRREALGWMVSEGSQVFVTAVTAEREAVGSFLGSADRGTTFQVVMGTVTPEPGRKKKEGPWLKSGTKGSGPSKRS